MANTNNDPRGWWVPSDRAPELVPGTILRARAPEDQYDPYTVVRVVGTHLVKEREEAVITPALTFGENVSVPISGDGGLLRVYDVLTEAEAAALLPQVAPLPADTVGSAARDQLKQMRDAAQEAA